MTDDQLFEAASARFAEIDARDPQLVESDGGPRPKQLVEAERLEAWVWRVDPAPSLALRLAARSQHLGRFELPRSEYPEGRVGYLSWRKELARRHAERTGAILGDLGAPTPLLDAVRAINLKQDLKGNPEVQTMEDALCLSFLEHDFVPFIERYTDELILGIVQKSWRKMSARGHELALTLPFSGRALLLIQRALSTP